jgi:cell division protein ZapA
MGDSVQIEVMGKKFVLKGTHDKEYIKRVEKYINEKIEEVKGSGGSITTHNLMVLVALNLVDDYLKKEDEINRLIKTTEDNSTRLIDLIDSHI